MKGLMVGTKKVESDCSQRCTVTGSIGSRYKSRCKNLAEHMKTFQWEGGCMLEVLSRLSRKIMVSPSLKIFKTHPDTALSNLL